MQYTSLTAVIFLGDGDPVTGAIRTQLNRGSTNCSGGLAVACGIVPDEGSAVCLYHLWCCSSIDAGCVASGPDLTFPPYFAAHKAGSARAGSMACPSIDEHTQRCADYAENSYGACDSSQNDDGHPYYGERREYATQPEGKQDEETKTCASDDRPGQLVSSDDSSLVLKALQ